MEDRTVLGHCSHPDPRCPGARTSRVNFENFPCRRNILSLLLAEMLPGRSPSRVTGATTMRLL